MFGIDAANPADGDVTTWIVNDDNVLAAPAPKRAKG